MSDPNRELQAMILCALPLPPLPVEVRRLEDGNLLGDRTVITSHDVLSQLLEAACVHRNSSADTVRQQRQVEVLRCLLMDLVKDGILAVDPLYDVYCRHTLSHVATYYPVATPPALPFMPLSYTCRGDAVHARMCDYMAGQSTVLGHTSGTTALEWQHMAYGDMLQECRNRIVSEPEPKAD